MCGILGCYRKEGVTIDDISKILNLIEVNKKRGPVAFGIVTPTKLYRCTKVPEQESLRWFLEEFMGEEFLFVHLRAPTGEGQNNLELTQPSIKGNSILLFNGMLIDWDKHMYENDTEDLIYGLHFHGEKVLNIKKGSFSICWKTPYDDILLARCINSLYYDDNFFSSTEFEGSRELGHGKILDFKTKELREFDAYTPYAIIKKEVNRNDTKI